MTRVGFHKRILIGLAFLLLIGLVLFIQLWGKGKASWEAYQLNQLPLQKLERADVLLHQQRATLESLTADIQEGGGSQVQIRDHFQFVEYLTQESEKSGVNMLSFPLESKEEISGYELVEEQFSIEGKLPAIMHFLYQIEVQDKIGRIVYLNVERKEIRIRARRVTVLVGDIKLNRVQKL